MQYYLPDKKRSLTRDEIKQKKHDEAVERNADYQLLSIEEKKKRNPKKEFKEVV